ncbi:hypothetical protein AB6A40_005200 [Gnathostoma spinigerum]|uniref:Uncharacterized protein n=1 Tax=Gnathostoma spinigerum TaxID=75299 RepID=A0ABD6EM35_9BILA
MAIYDGVFNLLTVSEAPKFSLFLLIESIAICFALYYFVFRRNKKRLPALTEKEKEELIAKWQPEPLVPDTPPDHFALHPKFIDGKMTKHVSIEGKDYLNLATSNFLGFVGVDRIEVFFFC